MSIEHYVLDHRLKECQAHQPMAERVEPSQFEANPHIYPPYEPRPSSLAVCSFTVAWGIASASVHTRNRTSLLGLLFRTTLIL